MIKRVNFTGRRRIPRDHIDIEVLDGKPRSFNATINLKDMGFLQEATVVVEATCAGSSIVQRFPFGVVRAISPPAKRNLEELSGENVFFGVKVIDQTERFGRILGLAENVKPIHTGKQTVAGRRGILPVEKVPLGDELWSLEFKDQDVVLLVNEDVPELWDRVRYDPMFYALVYPEVIRRVLDRAIEENVDVEEEGDRWPILWLRFGRQLHTANADPPSPDDTREEKDDWIEDIVASFCKRHSLKEKYRVASTSSPWEA